MNVSVKCLGYKSKGENMFDDLKQLFFVTRDIKRKRQRVRYLQNKNLENIFGFGCPKGFVVLPCKTASVMKLAMLAIPSIRVTAPTIKVEAVFIL